MVLKDGIEPSIQSYQDCVIPFNYESIMAEVPGLEPRTTESKSVELPITPHPNKMNCSLAPSELSLVFRHTEPDFLVSRLQRLVAWDT